MFEHFKEDILSIRKFVLRMIRFFLIATALLLLGLVPGIIGFQWVGGLDFQESLINSLSILGTIDVPYVLKTQGGQIFTAVYGLFIETIFLLSMAILFAPLVHRIFHLFHIDTK